MGRTTTIFMIAFVSIVACEAAASGIGSRLDKQIELKRQAEAESQANSGPEAGLTRTGIRKDSDTIRRVAPPDRQPAGPKAGPARPGTIPEASAEPPVVAAEHRIDLRVTFETDSAVIRPEAAGLLAELCDAIVKRPAIRRLNVIGHADASGSAERNRVLSRERAREVAAWLSRECGIEADRLVTHGLGTSRLLPDVPPVSEENRRVEVSVGAI